MKCGVSMGATAGQSNTRITGGIVHCQNKLRFPWIMRGLQVCTIVWSADASFSVKRKEPNERRGKFEVVPSWQFLPWVNAGAVQELQCVQHGCLTKADDTQQNV